MKTRLALALLFALLVALCAWGQTFQRSLPFLARTPSGITFTPTNLPGMVNTNNKGYYVASYYYTNSGNATWTNLWIPGENILSNPVAAYMPVGCGNFLRFTNDKSANQVGKWLRASEFGFSLLTETEGWEYNFLLADKNYSGNDAFWFDGEVLGTRNYAFAATSEGHGSNYTIYAGTSLFGGIRLTNKPCMITFLFKGANSAIYTNSTLVVSGNSGTTATHGLILGVRYYNFGSGERYWGGDFDLYELAIYNTPLTAAARSNLWYYWKWKYNFTD